METSLQDLIRNSLVPSVFDDQAREFLPAGFLDKLITNASVAKGLGLEESNLAEPENRDLADFIFHHARKVFAILVIIDFEESDLRRAMINFQKASFQDTSLPVKERHLSDLPCFTENPWTRISFLKFAHEQWIFLAPVFSKTNFRMDLDPECILPFIWRSKHAKEGSFDQVFEAKIHESNQDFPELRAGRRSLVTLQEITHHLKSTDEERSMEASALDDLRGLNHPHIVQNFATFTRGNVRHLIFESADGDLRELWQEKYHPILSTTLVKEMVVQLRGLAGALEALHHYGNETPNQTSYRGGDLKPENILRFNDGTAVGILKIANLGMGKHLTITTQSRDATTTKWGAIRYQPPEIETQQGMARSHLCDTWSLGCIYLEVMVWLLYGYEGLVKFNESVRGPSQESSPYHIIEAGNESKLHPTVQAFLNHISQDRECIEVSAMKDLLSLITNKMLVALPPNRPSDFGLAFDSNTKSIRVDCPDNHLLGPRRATARAVCDSLDAMIEKGQLDESYWCSGTIRENLNGPSTLEDMAKRILPATGQQESVVRLPCEKHLREYRLPQDELPAYGDELPAYGDELPAYGNERPAYGDELPAYGNELPAYGDLIVVNPSKDLPFLTEDMVRAHHFLNLFEGRRVPCLLISRASGLHNRWASSGSLECAHPRQSLVPEWFLRFFSTPNSHSAMTGVVIEHYDGEAYFVLNSGFQDALESEAKNLEDIFEGVAIVAHAIPDPSAEIGWDDINLKLQIASRSMYRRLVVLDALQIEIFLQKSPFAEKIMKSVLRLIWFVSRGLIPTQFSALPIMLYYLEITAERLQMTNEVVLRIDMMRSIIYMGNPISPLMGNGQEKFLQATERLSKRDMSEYVLEMNMRFHSSTIAGANAVQDLENFWAQLKEKFLNRITVSSPFEKLAEGILRVRASQNNQSEVAEAVVKEVEVLPTDYLIPKVMFGIFLFREKLYRPAERILSSSIATLMKEEHASPSALCITTTELVNCRNRMGMYQAGLDLAVSVLKRVSPTEEVVASFLSLKIAHSDSLTGQRMFKINHSKGPVKNHARVHTQATFQRSHALSGEQPENYQLDFDGDKNPTLDGSNSDGHSTFEQLRKSLAVDSTCQEEHSTFEQLRKSLAVNSTCQEEDSS